MGSDHCPVYVDLHETITTPEGQLHLRDLVNPTPRVPLPPQIAAIQDPERTAPPPPPFATCFWDEFSGKQRSLKDFFGKRGAVPPPAPLRRNTSSSSKAEEETQPEVLSRSDTPVDVEASRSPSVTSTAKLEVTSASTVIDLTEREASAVRPKNNTLKPSPASVKAPTNAKSKSGQLKLSSFFRQPSQEDAPSKVDPAPSANDEHADYLFAKALAEQQESAGSMQDDEERAMDQAEVVSTWSNIFAKKVPPKCLVHGLPCKPFSGWSCHARG
jgi:AP endonuclease-2